MNLKKIFITSCLFLSVVIMTRFFQSSNQIDHKNNYEDKEILTSQKSKRNSPQKVKKQTNHKKSPLLTNSTKFKKSNKENTYFNRRPLPSSVVKEFDEEEFNYQDEEGNIVITHAKVDDGYIITHGDIILAPEKELNSLQNKDGPLLLAKPKFWPHNKIPYTIDNDLENADSVRLAIKYFNEKTNIQLIKKTNEKNYVRFKKGTSHCYSKLGMVLGEQDISLSPNCKQGEIIHELVHTAGFLHEQNREDRDDYLRVIWENIAEENWPQFKKIKNNFLDLSQFPFDFKSIMLYGPRSFSVSKSDYSMVNIDGEAYSTNRQYLSDQDIKKINFFYPKDNI